MGGVVKYKKFFNLSARKFHFIKYKTNFFGENIIILFKVDFVLFLDLFLKSALGGPIYYYLFEISLFV